MISSITCPSVQEIGGLATIERFTPVVCHDRADSQKGAVILSSELDESFTTVTIAFPIDFGLPCQARFEELASANSWLLVSWIRSGKLSDAQLTYAAEALGQAQDELAESQLMLLLEHPNKLVREGAIYGAAKRGSERLISAIRAVSTADKSSLIREIASEALEQLG